jgi:hypothetical protein
MSWHVAAHSIASPIHCILRQVCGKGQDACATREAWRQFGLAWRLSAAVHGFSLAAFRRQKRHDDKREWQSGGRRLKIERKTRILMQVLEKLLTMSQTVVAL